MHDAVRPGPRPAREYYRACGGRGPGLNRRQPRAVKFMAPARRRLCGRSPGRRQPGPGNGLIGFTIPAPGGPPLPAGARLGTRRCSGSSRPKSTAGALSCQRVGPTPSRTGLGTRALRELCWAHAMIIAVRRPGTLTEWESTALVPVPLSLPGPRRPAPGPGPAR